MDTLATKTKWRYASWHLSYGWHERKGDSYKTWCGADIPQNATLATMRPTKLCRPCQQSERNRRAQKVTA